MGKTHTNAFHAQEMTGFSSLMRENSSLLDAYLVFHNELSDIEFPPKENQPNGAKPPQATLMHLFTLATEVVKQHLQAGNGAEISYDAILNHISENGLPPLPENAFAEGFPLKVGKAEVTLDAEQSRRFYALMEPLASSYASHKQMFMEQKQVEKAGDGASRYLEGRWNQFTDDRMRAVQAGLAPASELMKMRTKDVQQQLTAFTQALHFPAKEGQPEIQLRPQDAFALLTKVAAGNGRLRAGFFDIKADSGREPDYSAFLQAVARNEKLPYLSAEDFKRTEIEHNGVVFTPAQLETVYKAAQTVAPAYASWHKAKLDKAMERDARCEPAKAQQEAPVVDGGKKVGGQPVDKPVKPTGQEPAQGSDDVPPREEAKSEGAGRSDTGEKGAEPAEKTAKGNGAGQDEGQSTSQKVTKFLFDTTKGKITVAAAAVAIVSVVMAMMLGRKSNQQQNVVAGIGRQ